MIHSEKDIRIMYRMETGESVPDSVDPALSSDSSIRRNRIEDLVDYIEWLEKNIIYLAQNF